MPRGPPISLRGLGMPINQLDCPITEAQATEPGVIGVSGVRVYDQYTRIPFQTADRSMLLTIQVKRMRVEMSPQLARMHVAIRRVQGSCIRFGSLHHPSTLLGSAK